MDFKDLLRHHGIDSSGVYVLRHKPWEAKLQKVLPWLAVEKPDLFNAYQSFQAERVEASFMNASYIAAFIGTETNRAAFAGLYRQAGWCWMTRKERRNQSDYKQLVELGQGTEDRIRFRHFDLQRMDTMQQWAGRLIIGWPPRVRTFCLIADNNAFPVQAIVEDSVFDPPTRDWRNLDLAWAELQHMPRRLREQLREWRGIYQIYDTSDGRRYVGSAYGNENLLHRWINYRNTGHGNNKLLVHRNPVNFRFSILERLSPDMEADAVIARETSWKLRLHSSHPEGLNAN